MSKKLNELESFIHTLKLDVKDSALDCEHAHKTIKKLENKLQLKQENSDEAKTANLELYEEKIDENNTLSKGNKELQDENISLQTLVKEQASQIEDLHARI